MHRALLFDEILRLVFEYIHEQLKQDASKIFATSTEDHRCRGYASFRLMSLALVNRVWFEPAMDVSWEKRNIHLLLGIWLARKVVALSKDKGSYVRAHNSLFSGSCR